MPSAYVDEGTRQPCMLASCLAQGMTGVPTIPARVMNRDTQALLDTGSVVTLLRPDLAGGKGGGPDGGCLCPRGHPYLRDLPRGHPDPLTGCSPLGRGLSTHLPVPAPDWEGLPNIPSAVESGAGTRPRREPPRRGGRRARLAYGATRVPATPGESTAEVRGERSLTTGFPDPLGKGVRPGRIAGASPQAPRTP